MIFSCWPIRSSGGRCARSLLNISIANSTRGERANVKPLSHTAHVNAGAFRSQFWSNRSRAKLLVPHHGQNCAVLSRLSCLCPRVGIAINSCDCSSRPNNPELETCVASGEVEHANVAAIINTSTCRKLVEARQADHFSYQPLWNYPFPNGVRDIEVQPVSNSAILTTLLLIFHNNSRLIDRASRRPNNDQEP